jgi:hypothetical protein
MNLLPLDISTNVITVAVIVVLLNIPFGMWRKSVPTFSYQWFLAVHLPVPVIIALRLYSGLGFALYTYIILLGAFFGGQRIGAFIYSQNKQRKQNLKKIH